MVPMTTLSYGWNMALPYHTILMLWHIVSFSYRSVYYVYVCIHIVVHLEFSSYANSKQWEILKEQSLTT